ncbi:hypothetical protein [uncultured Helicobacter sp.]|uniref:hypothetical protein n=1 Tax=uncultured Helicobacter sp. TaxID=175537 RepID=UPI00261C536E|nr:hypothetical protein [uncultured Helicobacter sp.]
MKIALICDSLLLDRSLEMYLKEYLTSYKACDFVVATQPVESQKPVFLIGDMEGAHLKIPFTKELLLQELESFFAALKSGVDTETENRVTPKLEREIEEIRALNQTSANIIEPLDSALSKDLNVKLEAILKRYAKEIEAAILEHLGENRG